MSKLPPELIDLSDKIMNKLTIDNNTGTGNADADIYETTLPADLTLELTEKVGAHNANFVAASTHAFGRIAYDAMVGNKSLEQADVTIPMAGRDNVQVHVARVKEYRDPSGKSNDPIVKYGTTKTVHTLRNPERVNVLKAVQDELAELAASKIAK